MAKSDSKMRVYVGTYTAGGSKSEGIYLLSMDAKTGKFFGSRLVAKAEEPSFLAVSRNKRFLYAVNETMRFEGEDSGSVSAFEIDSVSGSLRFLNRQPSGGAAPCHLSVTDDGRYVLVANYMGGTVAGFPVAEDGSLKPASDIKRHGGNGPNAERQEAPHAHSVILDAANTFAIVNDLGTDEVISYALDSVGKLSRSEVYLAKRGAGPRHFKFHPNGKLAFANNELDMTVTSFAYDAKTGKLEAVRTLSTLAAGYRFTKADSGADLHVSPDGKFLYVSNRGHDSIAIFSIAESGGLTFLDAVKTGGKTPRNFVIDPSGNFLLSANQNSDSITVFRIDKRTGMLASTGEAASIPKPVCLVF